MFYDMVLEAVEYIRKKTKRKPIVGMILGSGLGGLVDVMEDQVHIPYEEIPHFPQSNVQGHAARLVFGRIGKTEIVAMQGRFHYYEGFAMKELTFPVYVMKQLGVENLIVTNACGGINQEYQVGDLIILRDYINMLGQNPLIGDNDERFGTRFPDMSQPYNIGLVEKAKVAATEKEITYKEGIYALFSGPCYETAAEIRAYSVLGADCIGMSTVPETIAANYLGMKVLGIACITNMATGIAKERHSHEEVVRIAEAAGTRLCVWVQRMLETWE